MPGPYERHVFICINDREPDHPRGDCCDKGGKEVRAAFKKAVADRGLRGRVRANAAGCLDNCEHGVSVVVYPEGVWYRNVSVADVDEIVDDHLIGDRPVERLRWSPDAPPTP